MRFSTRLTALLLYLCSQNAYALDPTDTLMDGDSEQSSYLPNHNMDPAVIQGGSFGQIWRFTAPPPANGQVEQFYAKPLVYTPSSTGRQIVLSFSEQNKIYALDAANGTLYASRDLSLEGETPFLVSDLGSCNDISGTIGITGTPVIDPTTDTVYFWAKSYLGAARGYQNGAYRFHGVDVVTLKERPGFPVNIQGHPADNDNTRIFTGGTVLQRVGLNLVNGVVFAGFGGHCDQYNYTGWIVGMSTTGKFVSAYSTNAGPGSPPQDGTWNGGGGGCGVWMGGMPLASDNSGRLFFVTGNGYRGTNNQQQPALGRNHLDTLSECMVNLAVDPQTGALTQQDYFEPYGYLAMDQGDRDLGSGGICLPDPATFKGKGVARMAITCGKNGQCYVVNRDDLGGYKLGPSGGDSIIQTLTPPGGGSIFANGGTYPLEGGYFYVTPVGQPTYVYGLGFSSTGLPVFTLVSQTAEISAGRVGTGPPTITTYKGQAGTGIMWVVDPDAGLRAYNAVPLNGNMTRISLPATPGVGKYQRPAFGNGRYYLSTFNGQILAYGSPVALALTCNSLDFGSVPIGTSATLTITCVANIPITSITGLIVGKKLFQAQNSSLPTGSLKAGASFSFPVVFNLTGYVLTAGSSSAPAVSPGVQTTSIGVISVNGQTGFSTEAPISVTGKSVSSNPFASISPLQVDFPGIVIGSALAAAGSASTFIISNIGQNSMTINGYAWTTGSHTPDPGTTTTYTNVTMGKDAYGNPTYVLDGNGYFTSSNLPSVGTVIAGGGSVTANALFNTTVIGDYFTTLTVYTDGGSAYTILTGAASTVPITVLEYSTKEGGWLTIPDCDVPANGCTSTIDLGTSSGLTISSVNIRFTNKGGSALVVTKSKPPEGTYLFANNPTTDLSEGLLIQPGNSSAAMISFEPGNPVLNADNVVYSGTWTLNTNDLTFGVHTLNFTGTLTSPKTGPLTPDGRALYKFLGCYLDNSNGVRLEPQKEFVNTNNTNGLCQSQSYAAGLVFAGTEYMQECWLGNVIPSLSLLVAPSLCNYNCPGDSTQSCGGNGGYVSLYYDSSRYFPSNGTIIGTSGKGPGIVQQVGAYNYSGCWTDGTAPRALSASALTGQTMTLESCAAFCSKYSIFGTEFGAECYCGNTLGSASTIRPDTECSMTCAGNATEFCGAGSRLSLYTNNATVSAALPSATPSTTSSAGPVATLGAYTYVGCQTDSVNKRTLGGLATTSTTMTIEQCGAFCSGYVYFGLEFSRECYCDNTLVAGSAIATDGRCSMSCAGSTAEICGGANGLSLYELTSAYNSTASASSATTTTTTTTSSTSSTRSTTSTAGPTIPASVGSFSYIDCHTDSTTSRTLQGAYLGSTSMTIEKCALFCAAFPYFGVEYGAECYCGNYIPQSTEKATDGRCNMKCAGTGTEICGGPNGLTLFGIVSRSSSSSSSLSSTSSSTTSSSTSTSSTSTSTMSTSSTSTSSTSTSSTSTSTTSTSSTSTSTSSSSSSPTSSSTSLSSTSTSTSTSSSSTSSSSTSTTSSTTSTSSTSSSSTSSSPTSTTTTSSSSTSSSSTSTTPSTTSTSSTSSSSTSSSSTSTSTSTTSSTSSSSTSSSSTSSSTTSTSSSSSTSSTTSSSSTSSSPTPSTSSSPWVYLGCANEPGQTRALNLANTANSATMTIESCQAFCSANNYPLAGVEYSAECYCGMTLASGSAVGNTGCTMKCSGNSTEYCGGPNRLNVYNNTAYVAPYILPSIGRYNLKGCYTDSGPTRALNGYAFANATAMTEEMCVGTCQAKGYSMAGIEYGKECYCDNALATSSTAATNGIKECQAMFCPGNSKEYCSAGNRLLVYSL